MLRNFEGRVVHAVSAGLCAAASSLFGKLSGIQGYSTCADLALKILLFVLMVACNAGVWMCFVKALQQSPSSLPPTVISTAINYVSSALLGSFVFGEETSLLWWSGATLVLLGLMLICHPHKQHEQ
ncbi:transmembrane protein 42 isoform X4 [Cryptotermes secundus]|uniref:transmembrane protein 42 isoform X4 n=1 Tax=Cryptotermes secundus TaxID=105785 RepID=UPI000CD7C69C|nr:transmembrane protein 42 isoform X4 [Cryptotermes secundus]